MDQEVIEREIWLLAARSSDRFTPGPSSPSASIEGWLKDDLTDGVKPLGRILYERGIPVLKETVELSIIRSAQVARELDISPDTPLVSRRYRLVNRKENGGWIINAMVQEVFSPSLVMIPESF